MRDGMEKFGWKNIKFKRFCQCGYKLAIKAEFLYDNISARPLLLDIMHKLQSKYYA